MSISNRLHKSITLRHSKSHSGGVTDGSMWYADDSSFLGLGTTNMDQSEQDGHHNPPGSSDGEATIARQLTGELYCIGCGYNLRGLSIRSNCPECGVPVRATILGLVDPHADELSPLIAPKLSAIGLNAWSMGAMIAVMMIWVLRIAEVLRDIFDTTWTPMLAPWIGISGLILSMIGGATMIRPHRGVNRLESIRSAIGVSLYGALIFVFSAIYLGHDAAAPSPLLDPSNSSLSRSILRIAMFLLIAGIILGLRPQAVGLAVRSVVVRTGRVDRQSLMALLASLGIAATGDLIHVLSTYISMGIDDVLSIISVVVISLGSVLFTVGMVNICIDTVRLFPVLVRPGVGLSDIFETNHEKSRRSG
jgi:hypothetical protein